jgi:arylsulfatase A-like enzyme
MPDEEVTLAEALSDAGYRTGHFGKWHLGTLTTTVEESNRGGPRGAEHYAPPWEHGFDTCFSTEASVPTYDPMIATEIEAEKGWIDAEDVGGDYGTYYWTGPGEVAVENLDGDDSRVIMDRAVPFIREAVQDDDPFLAVVWFHSPHEPVVGGPEYRERYAHRTENEQHYYGTISAIDDQIGRLRDELADLGVTDETMLWFTSDNGPAAEGGGPGWHAGLRQQGKTGKLRGQKGTLYEGGVRVPGTLVWPDGIDEPRTVDVPCVTSDYYPTILDAVGVDVPDQPEPLDGMSLMPVLSGETNERPAPIGFEHGDSVALIDGDYKLIRRERSSAFELYDLGSDRYETDDISGEFPDRVEDMKRALRAWRESCDASRNGADY